MTEIYKYIYKISNRNKFTFVIIILCSILLLRNKNIKLAHILGIIVGILICWYLNSYYIYNQNSEEEIYHKKKKEINFNYKDYYSDIINLVYQLEDLKKFNNRNYDLFVLSIRKFIEIDNDYKNLIEAESEKKYLIQSLKNLYDYKNKSLDYLLEISIKVTNKSALEKIQNGLDQLESILNCYIKENKILGKINYNDHHDLIDLLEKNIKPYNYKI